MPKDPKKIMFMMTILCIVIGLAAISRRGTVAVAKENTSLPLAMLAGSCLADNQLQTMEKSSIKPDFSEVPSTLSIQAIWHLPNYLCEYGGLEEVIGF